MKEKNTQKRGFLHKLILVVLIGVLAVSGFSLVRDYLEGWKAQKEYEKLAQMVSQEEESSAEEEPSVEKSEEFLKDDETAESFETEPRVPYVSPIDFDELAKINPDVVGWIRIPDTNIDYPIVQTDDNDTYLHLSFEGEETTAGTIFLDFECQKDMRGYNNIIYGHHMRNGSMFKDIVRFKDEDYFKEHQYFEIYTPKQTIHLKAVSCYYIANDPNVRRTKFRVEESFQEYVQKMLEPCSFAEIPQEPVHGLYTLITCSYEVNDGRTVLYAVEVEDEESLAAKEDE